MRTAFIIAGVLLPQLGWAQLFGGNSFKDGSYVLADRRTLRYTGQLKLQDGTTLVVKNPAGKNLKLNPVQVASFRIGSQRYVPAGNFHVSAGIGGMDVDAVFAEQLDSGQVQLLRYNYSLSTPGSMGAGGTMTGGGSWGLSAFLLRKPSDIGYTVAQSGPYSSKRLREALRPFLASRPDLIKLLDDKRINDDNIQAVIHALNTNSPYSPPPESTSDN